MEKNERPVPQPAIKTFKLGRAAFLALTAGSIGALAFGKRAISSIDFVPGVVSAQGFTIYTVTAGYPTFSPQSYRLRIDGMVDHPLTLTLQEILTHPAVTVHDNYQCVTGWQVPNTRWKGIRLSDLLDRVQPHAASHAVKFYSFDGAYTESLTMDQARQSNVLLAYQLDGKPLSRAQGAPLRLVVPGMYGYKYAKWLNRVELIPHAVNGFWENQGYDRDAYIGKSNQRYQEDGPQGSNHW